MTSPAPPALDFMWLEITGKCQLECRHCYNESGPKGTDGSMGYSDWIAAIDQAAALGVSMVQFIGGEPTLYAGLPGLLTRALSVGMEVEVYSNLVHVRPQMWELFSQPRVRLATSYYSDNAAQHRQITGRPSLPRTRANIARAVEAGIPLRVGIIDLGDEQRIEQAHADLTSLGVTNIGTDRMRLLGRAAHGGCDVSELCGRCGDGIAAILPDGTIAPCPLARWLTAGNVTKDSLAELAPRVRSIAASQIGPAHPDACRPPCEPQCTPGCNPSVDEPGGGDGCTPKQNCQPNQSCKPQMPCQPDVSCKPK
ncbi:radical SAM/SPASM domain-containing protein [Nonomuraea sp. KM90]|uniref:radical SAM/SPASM domain-containing protein n=1 Tax=Nonomuraea sp. KM90 TaxID=3457428 RepID=UPI003FCD99A3